MSNAFNDELAAAAGHNSGITPAELVADEIESALTQFVDRAKALVKSAEARTVTDNDEIGKAADIRSMIKTLTDSIMVRAREVAAPHHQAVQTVKGRTERFLADLETADAALVQKISTCREDQRVKAQRQRDEQAAAEAALRPAHVEPVNPQIDSAPVSLPAVKGDYGSRVGDRKLTTYAYADPRKLPRAVLDMPEVEKAIQSALRAYAKVHALPKTVTAIAGVTTTHRRPI